MNRTLSLAARRPTPPKATNRILMSKALPFGGRHGWHTLTALLVGLTVAAVAPSAGAAGATYTVTNVDDSGTGSLRQAILNANANPGADIINFNIGSGAKTIALLSGLPSNTEPVVIDGSTQPGYAGTPLIMLEGSAAQSWATGLILHGNSTVQGLTIGGFGYAGVFIYGGGNVVEGCYLGLNAAGTAARANGSGILASWNASGPENSIRGNVISGNLNCGIQVDGPLTPRLRIVGNRIGTNAAGTAAVPNLAHGVKLFNSHLNIVGGDAAEARNVISGNGANGISLEGGSSGTTIQGNYLGTDCLGANPLPNNWHGIVVSDAPDNSIVNNVVSGNAQVGMLIQGASSTGNLVAGNRIGTDSTGAVTLGNGGYGLVLSAAPNNRVGGTTPEERNIISGNGWDGILIDHPTATGNTVMGNYIGTDQTGTAPIPNLYAAITVTSHGNTIGGTVSGAGNLLSGNRYGIYIANAGTGAADNIVLGNLIGTDYTGLVALPNTEWGIVLDGASNTLVGGTAAGAKNVISGNQTGMAITASASGNVIQGNYLGVNAAGQPLGNTGHGVLAFGASANSIGGMNASQGNLIAYNGAQGVVVINSTGISVQSNRIFNNGGLGIDLGHNGITVNDDVDADTGANLQQNFPVLGSVHSAGGTTTVQGSLASSANTQFRLEFFANSAGDPSGYGEGEQYLGSTSVTTNGVGTAAFTATLPVAAADGTLVSATATDPSGNTSEFSATRLNAGPPDTTPPTGQFGTVQTRPGAGGTEVLIPVNLADSGSGVIKAQLTSNSSNCYLEWTGPSGVVSVPIGGTITLPVPAATTQMRAVKLNSGRTARVELRIWDAANNTALVDPIIALLEMKTAAPLMRIFKGLPAVEHYLLLQNRSPGLRTVRVWVNGRLAFHGKLTNEQELRADLRTWMLPGSRNSVQVLATGPRSASALLTIGDASITGAMRGSIEPTGVASRRLNVEFAPQ